MIKDKISKLVKGENELNKLIPNLPVLSKE